MEAPNPSMWDTISPYVIGVGISLIVGFILLFIEYRTKWFARFSSQSSEKDRGSEEKFSPIQPAFSVLGFEELGPEYQESPGPGEILDTLKGLPPVQRESVAHHYVGLKVKWRVVFSAVSRFEDELVLHLKPIPAPDWPLSWRDGWIRCSVDSKLYPKLNILQEDSRIWVAGEIESLRSDTINLAPGAVLRFVD